MASAKVETRLFLVFCFATRKERHIGRKKKKKNPLNQGSQIVFNSKCQLQWLVEAARSAMLKKNIKPQTVLIKINKLQGFSS